MKTLVLGLIWGGLVLAQTSKTVTLTWDDTRNPSGTTYSVKRATGLCTGTPTFNTIATGLAVKTYDDTPISPGNYCYVVTATSSGLESAASNSAPALVTPFVVINVKATEKE